jgi:hypothetical protein
MGKIDGMNKKFTGASISYPSKTIPQSCVDEIGENCA